MKTFAAGLTTAYAATTADLAQGTLVMRTDGQTFGWTDYDQNVTIAGVTYLATEGLEASTAHTTDTGSVDTIDVTAFLSVSTEADIAAGLWDDATVTVFEYIWSSLPSALDSSVNILRYGNLGQIRRQDDILVAEVRGLVQRLSRRVGRLYSPTCPWRLGDAQCTVSLGSYTHTGTVSAVNGTAPRLRFSDSGQAQAPNYFNDGELTWTSGPNNTLKRQVRLWQNGEFQLYLPLPYDVQVGNTYSAVRGDDKTFATCRDVYNNAINFGGFPYVPGQDAVYSNPAGL